MLFAFTLIGDGCPKSGLTKKGTPPKFRNQCLNIKKNRDFKPTASDIDKTVTLQKMMDSRDDSTAFSEHKAATVEGYILKAKDEGMEGCNCYSTDPADHDVHVYISPDPNVSSIAECVVIEITPYTRNINPEWTSEYINQNVTHKKIKVTGWLMFDWEHLNQSFETNLQGERIYRRTVWELHPITDISLVQ